MAKTYLLERKQIIPRSRSEVFAFFSDAFNLERLTPSFLRFRILTPPPIRVEAGTVIEYRLTLLGVRFNWRTLIEQWRPEECFVDRQLKGPYALWLHTHSFEEQGPRRTLIRDRVEYSLPFGVLGEAAHALFVKHFLKMIFNHRARITSRLLGAEDSEEAGIERDQATIG